MNEPFLKSKRQSLKKELKWGDIEKISTLADVNRITVERYFEGESDNMTVQECVVKLIDARKTRITNQLKDIA